jgi:hypothetical protein
MQSTTAVACYRLKEQSGRGPTRTSSGRFDAKPSASWFQEEGRR